MSFDYSLPILRGLSEPDTTYRMEYDYTGDEHGECLY